MTTETGRTGGFIGNDATPLSTSFRTVSLDRPRCGPEHKLKNDDDDDDDGGGGGGLAFSECDPVFSEE
jgi:hypothetical protein